MINGMVAGVRTICWVIFLLVFLIYVLSVLLVNVVGPGQGVGEHVSPAMVGTIPEAGYTVFRCFMGDCSTDTGLPLSYWLSDELGAPFTIFYVIVMVYFMFGILSLVIAVITE